MKDSFKNYLTETELSFYNLYNRNFPSAKINKIKDLKKKKEALDKEEKEYLEILGSFLRNTSAMN